MFCPQCGGEYQAGSRECADCQVPLVDQRPPARAERLIDGEEILSTYNVGDIAFVRSLLEASGIPFLFHGENFAVVDPLIQPARLLVPPEYAERARELLRDVDIHFMGINIGNGAPAEDEDEDEDEGEEGGGGA